MIREEKRYYAKMKHTKTAPLATFPESHIVNESTLPLCALPARLSETVRGMNGRAGEVDLWAVPHYKEALTSVSCPRLLYRQKASLLGPMPAGSGSLE